MAIEDYCGETASVSEWDRTLAKQLLSELHLGDYVRINYTGSLLRSRKKVAEGYVAGITLVMIELSRDDPLGRLMNVPFLGTKEIELDTISSYQKLERPKK